MKKFEGKSSLLEISIILLLTILMMPTSGCITVGNKYISQENFSLLKENQTTKAEAMQLLGKPYRTTKDPNGAGETLVYEHIKNDMFSEKMDWQTVNLYIDESGILKKKSVNERISSLERQKQFIEPEKIKLLESKVNQYTKADVINLIGNPDYTGFGENGEGERFMYFRIERKDKLTDYVVGPVGPLVYYDGTADKEQRLNLFIDDNNILRKVTFTDKPTKMRGGILAK
jgi:outer membrane protein assembly factor BamE (lipoprotein component of BamABCDE complex)